MNDTYYVLQQATEFQFKEKGSKFLAFALPVQTEEQAKQQLTELRKKYYDATHHCYAYTVGHPQAVTRQSDDGEPSGTAGLPIQNQIRAKGVKNVLVVVVRYYGGTKLGVAGLVQAYKTAAAGVLDKAKLQTCYLTALLSVKVPFAHLNDVMMIAKKHRQQPMFIENMNDPQQQQLAFQVRLTEWPAFEEALRKLHYVTVATENSSNTSFTL